ncbi:GH92 family glycosyl hydrolase [Amycolatopsis rhabdoformis]|uniref:GH92 family glycosyl hydrolase n=1 Tax=Amycolatopsis rhabdoformis TaxID=1448059 RepID=A0ABZ1IEC6_9PSEU|nr:GH92 family glycosyl hydrolase [Amycolatopsis rhabdoformis]WSE32028.1 GH92 family glycosyl hydrolase [Amycolatopsis rhabdoformis]
MTDAGSLSRRGFLVGTSAVAAVTALPHAAVAAGARTQPVDSVDPIIGSVTTAADTACGKTFPGAVAPFGLVQLSPDTVSGGDNGSGYSAEMTTIEGFSFLHMSGVGCYGDLGNLQVLPQTGPLVTGRDEAKSPYRKETETARAGYYAVELDRYRVRAELTATERAGLLRFTFHDAGTGRVKVDLTRRIGPDGSHSIAQHVRQVDATTVEGWLRCDHTGGGWGCGAQSPAYTVYFTMEFPHPIAVFGTWDGTDVRTDLGERDGTQLGFFAEFPVRAGQQVPVRAGVSFVDLDGARRNLRHDLPGWGFDAVAAGARRTWADALGKVAVEGGTAEQREIFETALYHSMIDPRLFGDVDGRHRVGDTAPVRDGVTHRTLFSGWDVFRAQFPLLTIIDPDVVQETITSLVSLTDRGLTRGLARWELLGKDTDTMLGDAAVNVIAEAYLKGLRGFDVEKAYRFCREVALGPAERSNRTDFANWTSLGYCVTYSLSSTVENAYTDYALARFAEALGKKDDAKRLYATSLNYRNLFNPDAGWFRGRNADGTWMGPADGCIESNPEQQGWFVPHDVGGLVRLAGGRAAFLDRLNGIFENTPPDLMMKWNEFYNHSNEPVQQMPFLFTYAGAPWLTQKWSRYVLDHAYRTGATGLAGNDDAGQMSAWYVLAAAGFYPVSPASGVYLLGSPLFDRARFTTGPGRTFTVHALDNSAANVYISSATLNGRPLHRAWLTHAEVIHGGELVLRMSAKPNRGWGVDALPPSLTSA